MPLSGYRVLLGVTGGIACYKSCEIVSSLRKLGAQVDVVMTEHACQFVSPMTFESLSGNRVVSDMFARPEKWDIAHVSLAQRADLCVIAPATANVLAKLAYGIADDMLTTTALALRAPLIVAPAMNTAMYEHPATQTNLRVLRARGVEILEPDSGRLACGDVGKGKMAEPAQIVECICARLTRTRDLQGKRILVTAGATQENVDGVRFLTNRSSGKMGIAIAHAAVARGAQVTLVAGICSAPLPSGCEIVRVQTTMQMYEAVTSRCEDQDWIVKAAAPADYRPREILSDKAKGDALHLDLVKNPDIAAAVGAVKGDRKLIVFCAETRDLLDSARRKLVSKHADMVVANDVTAQGAGFDVDTNVVTLVTERGEEPLEMMTKDRLAHVLLDRILRL